MEVPVSGSICEKHHLSVRERIALRALIEGKTVSEAARLAGYAHHSGVSNQLNGRNFRLKAAFNEMMDVLGLSDEAASSRIEP